MRMQLKTVLLLLSVSLVEPMAAAGKQTTKIVYKNPKAPLEGRVEDLLSRMTLKEKVLQLNQG